MISSLSRLHLAPAGDSWWPNPIGNCRVQGCVDESCAGQPRRPEAGWRRQKLDLEGQPEEMAQPGGKGLFKRINREEGKGVYPLGSSNRCVQLRPLSQAMASAW